MKGEKEKERKDTRFGILVCTKTECNRNKTECKQHNSESVCSTFATVNPTKSTPILMKIGDNTTQDVYKHPKLKSLKKVVWFDHKSNFTTHIQFELFL